MPKLPSEPNIKGCQLGKPEAKAWIGDLRSGLFKQTRTGRLFNSFENAYCCIGVLAKRLDALQGDLQRSYVFEDSGFLGEGLVPNPFPSYRNLEEILAGANDTGASFEEIADWLEVNLLPACQAKTKHPRNLDATP